MEQTRFYYTFEPAAIDVSDEKEAKKYGRPFIGFENDLSDRFRRLKEVYDRAEKEDVHITVNAFPPVSGVAEIAVFHEIKFRLFSRAVKKQCFFLCITKYEADGTMDLYEYETNDFRETEQIFRDFLQEGALPDLTRWKRIPIG